MIDQPDATEQQRNTIRERFAARRAQVADVPAQKWTAQRDEEASTVRQAAARRRHAA